MKIILIRKKLNMTQAELAEAAGATQQQIALIEKGMTDPRLSTLYKIAAALKVDIHELFFVANEFVDAVNYVIEKELSNQKMSLEELNIYCGENHNISSFDPNWSKVTLSKSYKLILKKKEV